MDKNHLWGIKNLRKTIFNVLEANLAFDIFEILKFFWWPEMADGRLKIGRTVRSKLFCHLKDF